MFSSSRASALFPQKSDHYRLEGAEDGTKPQTATHTAQRLCWILASLASLAIILGALYIVDRGFDITDEAYYLFWISAPGEYLYSGTMFGHLLEPFMALAGGDIATLRRLSLVLLVIISGAGWFAWKPETSASLLSSATIALCLSAFSLFLQGNLWIPTPSYNALAIFAGFALFAALGLLARDAAWPAAALLAGFAGLCSFASRPSAGAAFAAIYAAAIIVSARSPRQALRDFLAAGVATLLLGILFGLLIVDPAAIWRQYQQFSLLWMGSGELSSQLGKQLHSFATSPSRGALLVAGFGLIGLALVIRRLAPSVAKRGVVALAALYLLIACGLIVSIEHHLNYPILLIMLATCSAIAIISIAMVLDSNRPAHPYVVLALALLIPFVAQLGTGSDITRAAFNSLGVTAVVVVVSTARAFGRNVAAIPALCFVVMLACTLWASLAKPYRLPADIWSQSTAFAFPRHGTLLLDSGTHAMLSTIRDAAVLHGFAEDTPVLDFTGQSPGIVFAMGGSAPGTPWLVGGYQWSDRQLVAILDSLSEEQRRNAWILWGENRRAVSRDRLRELGFDLGTGYSLVTEVPHSIQKWRIGVYAPLHGDKQ
ncbi:hypothetical protein [Pseudaminobacter salicylatoxidans]|uniref:hypothetical protein n=1 Tax=Pseudaminobacter salicylatoxidans TaxID=93369 RepID=UPI0002FE087C|nr:hypothetical protein [Pseudaminobacter salicylatoxidans]